MSNALNLNSQYVAALVDYIRDVKPYHSKLTDVIEEYQFSDRMSVKITDSNSSKLKIDSTWITNYFSSGDSSYRSTSVKGLFSNLSEGFISNVLPSPGRHQIGRDEIIELFTPTSYSKQAYDGLGASRVFVETDRDRTQLQEFIEGHEYFVSHGAFQFQILQQQNASLIYDPRWAELSALDLPPISGEFSYDDIRESGKPTFYSIQDQYISITDISSTSESGDTWDVKAVSGSTFEVRSSIHGFVGTIGVGVSIIGGLKLKITILSPVPLNHTIKIRPANRIVFSESAPLEAWSLIQTNPIAYSLPVLNSTRYGRITGVTLIFPGARELSTGAIILTARSDGITFDVSSTVDSFVSGTATANVPYNDGRIAFTILTGSVISFALNDRFIIPIQNVPPIVSNVDLGYGYDLDSYDAQGLQYDVGLEQVNFAYDGRFDDFDFVSLNLTANQTVQSADWKLVAIPNLSRPIATIKKDGSGPSATIDLQDQTSGVSPDVASTAVPLYSMLDDSSPAPDLTLYYADQFELRSSADGYASVIDVVDVGSSYSANGLEFTVPVLARAFVAVQSDDGLANPLVSGGDVFTFTTVNAEPVITEASTLISGNVPRLIPHGGGFYDVAEANWTIAFTSSDQFSVSGIQLSGPNTGLPVSGSPVTGTLSTNGVLSIEGTSFNDLNISFTISIGLGLAAGDTFTFRTYDRKPTCLVYGSVSGWQTPAVVDEPYWNGFIGFELKSPVASLFKDGVQIEFDSTISITRLRANAPSNVYTFKPISTGWLVYSSISGLIGLLSVIGSVKDDYITIESNGLNPLGSEFKINVVGTSLVGSLGQDIVIIKSTAPLVTGDHILIDKLRTDTLSLNLDYSYVAVSPDIERLGPETIDVRFIDLNPHNSVVPISATSSDVIPLKNFIPVTVEPFDSETSVAEFSDLGKTFNVRARSTNELIGTITNDLLVWDQTFFNSFLPLNTESNLISRGSGFNDKLNVRMNDIFMIFEKISFIDDVQDGPSFDNIVTVSFLEQPVIQIRSEYEEEQTVVISDGPFDGVLPGFDNLPYDEEIDGYDAGVVLTGLFNDAQALAALSSPTPAEEDRLSKLVLLLSPFLNGTLAATTASQFLANVTADPASVTSIIDSGLPSVGLGVSVTIGADGANTSNSGTESSATSIQEAFSIVVNVIGAPLDDVGFENTTLDAVQDTVAILSVNGLPPIPTVLPPITTFDAFETPLTVLGSPARVFDIQFIASPVVLATMGTPTVFIWAETAASPVQADIVERVRDGLYRIQLAVEATAKLYVQ